MKLGIYDVINNPLSQLYVIKEINVKESDFKSDDSIVKVLNEHLQMNKLNSEHIYALSLTYGLIPKGIIQVSVGKCDKCEPDIRKLAIGLLLTGAEQFICFHNHPGGNKKISDADRNLTSIYKKLGNTIGVEFCKHIMITQNYFDYCENIMEINEVPFK